MSGVFGFYCGIGVLCVELLVRELGLLLVVIFFLY